MHQGAQYQYHGSGGPAAAAGMQAQYGQANGQDAYARDYAQAAQQYAAPAGGAPNYNDAGYGVYDQQQQLQQQVPGAFDQQQEEPLRVTMLVPEGAVAGTKLQYAAPDGQELRLTVPEGVPPGSTMTLTQDPVTKQWKCMAEPVDEPYAPPAGASQPQQQQQYYGNGAHQSQASAAVAPAERMLGGGTAPYAGGAAAGGALYPTGQAPTMVSRTMASFVQPMPGYEHRPVNLSYVPPPQMNAGQTGRCNGAEGYIEQRPSYTPMPQVMQHNSQPTAMLASTNKVHPHHVAQQLYAVQQTPSYVPPPVMPMMPNNPSYVPPPGIQQHPTMDGQVYGVQQTPSYVPPPAMPVMPNNPSYVPPPGVQQGADGASVQLPAGMNAMGQAVLPQTYTHAVHGVQQAMFHGATAPAPVYAAPQMASGVQQMVHGQVGQTAPGGFGQPAQQIFGLQPPGMIGVGPLHAPHGALMGGFAGQAAPAPYPGITRYGPDGLPVADTMQQMPMMHMPQPGLMYG